MKNQPFHRRVGFALNGWRQGWRRERSFRTQIGLGGVGLLALVMLRPAPIWWAAMALTIGAVLALELVNAAVEAVIDRLHPEEHPEIGAAKDMAAGAVLIASLGALIVGMAMMVEYAPQRLVQWGVIGR